MSLEVLFAINSPSNQCITNTTWAWRLPDTIIPSHYSVNLTVPDPNAWDPAKIETTIFSGVVEIKVVVQSDTTCVILHIHPTITVTLPVELTLDDKEYSSTEQHYDKQNMQVTFIFTDVLPAGTAGVLKISFKGKINSKDASGLFLSENVYNPPSEGLTKEEVGLMLSKWQSKKIGGKKNKSKIQEIGHEHGELMFATQLEEADARRVFPCFDEPALKAIYQASITIPKSGGLTVLFNTEMTQSSNSDDSVTFEFANTKNPMSSYLVAIAVGKFDFVEQKSKGVKFRVYTPPGASKYGKFALNVSVRVVDYFSSIWSFPLSNMMDKMDQISVPAIDYDAMENWGLLTYSPAFLLVDPTNATRAEQEMVALVTVHEISHQWFGDTVTCPWWTAEYLNEGFARLLQFVGVDYLFPDWQVWTTKSLFLGGDNSFYGFSYNKAMGYDYKGTAPPIYVPQKDNGKQSSHIFYEKGASVNRMFLFHLGVTEWNKGLAFHINHHKWTNPNVYDLMDSFKVSGPDPEISSHMLSWLLQPGFPIVTLSLIDNEIVITQEPVSSSLKDQLWFIPLNVRATLSNPDGTAVKPSNVTHTSAGWSTHSTSVKLPSPGKKVWRIEGNYNYTGFYLTNYAQVEQWSTLLDRFSDPSWPIIYRQQFTEQIFYLSNTNLTCVEPLRNALNLMPQIQYDELQRAFFKIQNVIEKDIGERIVLKSQQLPVRR